LSVDGPGIFDLKIGLDLIDCFFVPIDISGAAALEIDIESEL
jgi:hypothetical protein